MSSHPLTSPHRAAVFTWVDPMDRPRVEAAGTGLYQAVHHETVDALAREVRRLRPAAVLMSVGRSMQEQAPRVARLVREFPRVPMVALLSRIDQATPHAVLNLGNCGIRTLMDVRDASGWNRLREFVANEAVGDIDRLALGMLREELEGSTDDCWRFFELLFRPQSPARCVGDLAKGLGVLPSTMVSRFFRRGLPSPKQYLAWAKLIRAARVMENPGLSINDIANQLDYSSAQGFGRHVKLMLGLTAGEFRRQYTGRTMLLRFRDELLRPYRETLLELRPVSGRLPGQRRGEPLMQ